MTDAGGGELRSAVCSITRTARKRFFWAAWWTGAPHRSPFRRPDASNGGASTEEDALAEAERTADRHLVVIEPYWARAWNRVLRGEPPPPLPPPPGAPRRVPSRDPDARASSWSILGLEPGALPSDVRSAYKKRALETHPDQGGDADTFREVQRAYERLRDRAGPKRRQ